MAQEKDTFNYSDERFADLQMLRYRVDGFDELTLKQKTFIYYLQEAALWGRDIIWDQNCEYNLRIRKVLEDAIPLMTSPKWEERLSDGLTDDAFKEEEKNRKEFWIYLKRVWFSNGIHHHYGMEKFMPGFSREWFQKIANCPDEIEEIMFNPDLLNKRVNLAEGDDLVASSACNYYKDVTQEEVERFYEKKKELSDKKHPEQVGMNTTLCRKDGELHEEIWTTENKYGKVLKKIVENLKKAREFAEDDKQKEVIDLLVEFYEKGDPRTFDKYSIAWVENTEPLVDFVNGFIECYGDPLGIKCSWESIVNFKDIEATKRTETLSNNAQWFEDNSPVNPEFKKKEVKGVTAKVIKAAILSGDLYPASAIGINLPNNEWIRAEHGSKSVTIGNLTDAYNKAAKGNGMLKEFAFGKEEIDIVEKYGDYTDDLHTDLHECLGHGSGRLLEGVSGDALKNYGSTIEEARADLFALYYLADPKLVELGLLPDMEAYKASYIGQMQNGLLTQLVRIKLGDQIEESHMRNRALIARWCLEQGKKEDVMEFVKRDGKTYVKINDYQRLRELVGELLAEVQRIKSTGDFEAAKNLVENYGVKIDIELHKEILARYEKLNIAPYKGFINPVYEAIKDNMNNIIDVKISYGEGYAEQMLRYSSEYSVK